MGKVDLFEVIECEGLIVVVGWVLGMSYWWMWILVDEMNCCFYEKLVDMFLGGG